MKRIIILSLLCLLPLMSGCNTVQGVGKDITAIGKAVQKPSK